jgi:hypothetical protein
MSNSLDYVSRGIQRAFARLQAEKAKQAVQEVINDLIESNADVTTVKPSATSVKQSDEQYRMSIISKAISIIHKRKTA